MTILRAAPPLIIGALLLAGCSAEPAPVPAAPLSSTASSSAAPAPSVSSAWGGKRPTDVQLQAFATAFRQAYPQLAAGRQDKPIANDADNTCLDLAQSNDEASVLRSVTARFGRDGITPDAKTAAGILALIRKAACPPSAAAGTTTARKVVATPPKVTTSSKTPSTTKRTSAASSKKPTTTTKPVVVASYANCSEVRAAGAAPIHRGEPGYRPGLDRDGDGIACDTTG
jgi:hypothetical protein